MVLQEKWFNGLNQQQQLLLKGRDYICGPHAEIYYRSCEAFKERRVRNLPGNLPISGDLG